MSSNTPPTGGPPNRADTQPGSDASAGNVDDAIPADGLAYEVQHVENHPGSENLNYHDTPPASAPPMPMATARVLPRENMATSVGGQHSPEPTAQVDGQEAIGAPTPFVSRSRVYGFVLDQAGQPIELGSGRFAKAYLGEERWVQSKTSFRRHVAIKALQAGVSPEDQMRFQMEKEILERVQGHPNIVEILASGEAENPHFVPPQLRDRVENDYMILELLDMSLEERLKGSRNKRRRDDLLAVRMKERIFRVLDYVIPVATAIEYTHLVCDSVHRDIKPANVLLKLPDPNLRGSQLTVKLADFNVGKVNDPSMDLSMTSFQSVPGTMYFQSPEQEVNTFELLVNVQQGSPEVEFFEDFYIDIHENDKFAVFNRPHSYDVASADRSRKRLILTTPFQEPSEANVRAKVTKSVGRPADIYSLGAFFYYLVTGAYSNPKSLHDAFRKFIEWEKKDEANTVLGYIEHEYGIIQNLRAPKQDENGVALAPDDRFFTYKHYLDGNGELIDPAILTIIAKAMIRNKPDSYCQSWDLRTGGISEFVDDLYSLYVRYGVDPAARNAYGHRAGDMAREPGRMRRAFEMVTGKFSSKS